MKKVVTLPPPPYSSPRISNISIKIPLYNSNKNINKNVNNIGSSGKLPQKT